MHTFGISFHSSYPFAASATIRGKPIETQSTALVITIGATDCTTALHHFFTSTDDKLVGSLQPPNYGVRHAGLTVGLLAIDILPLKTAAVTLHNYITHSDIMCIRSIVCIRIGTSTLDCSVFWSFNLYKIKSTN